MADIPEPVQRQLDEAVPEQVETGTDSTPVYRMLTTERIPVSKHRGPMWKSRRDAAKTSRNSFEDAWNEAIRYYNNDQLEHRESKDNKSGNTRYTQRRNEQWSETENIVFSNISAIVPTIYSKNPRPEFTAINASNKDFASAVERLIYALSNMEYAPGFNLKPKAKQAVVNVLLTNLCWSEVSYTTKADASETAVAQLKDIETRLKQAKDEKEILEIEGELQAMEDVVSFLSPSGPEVRVLPPQDVLVDPDATAPDFSDALWMMKCAYLPTKFLDAKFGKKDGTTVKSLYNPTHVLRATNNDPTETFSLFSKEDAEPKSYGYDNTQQLRSAFRTKVWFVWDKTTRRIEMYADDDWSWPIWVWDDPYKLPRFFPFRPLMFHTAAIGAYTKGETTYYLDQQDAINEINDEERRARRTVKHNVLFNSNSVKRDDVEAVLKGPDGTARGVDLPEGQKMDDVIWTPTPPFLKFPQLFDPTRKYAAIDRLAGVTEVMRGAQFKTNTTNEAIENYNASTSLRVDEKLDAIEDWIGGIYADVAFVCLQFMDERTARDIVGDEVVKHIRFNMRPDEIKARLVQRVVGGSTQKPTTQAKKREAVQVGQVLGQFAKAAPLSVLMVTLKLFEQAFDEIVITDNDWKMLQQEAQAMLQQQQAGPEQEQAANGQAQPDEAQIQQAIQALVQRGVPPEAAKQQILARLQRRQ